MRARSSSSTARAPATISRKSGLQRQTGSPSRPMPRDWKEAQAMSSRSYHVPPAGHPPQTELLTGRAVFTEAYAVIPKGVIRDIVASYLPHWDGTRVWVLARPLSGFAETFSHYLVELSAGGGSDAPEPDAEAEGALFVVGGELTLRLAGADHVMHAGGFAYIPPGSSWSVRNCGAGAAHFHWIRKLYQRVPDLALPDPIVTDEAAITPSPMPGTDEKWATTRFVDPADLRHDMHITIVTFEPGASIPFAETHVMEHGLDVLHGKAVNRLNQDRSGYAAGDYMWRHAFR